MDPLIGDAERFRKKVEECRQMAAKAISEPDKEGWAKLASDWLRLAENAETKGRFRF